ncbi:sulfurtransferase complex subunit TusB [Methyloprofundus sp.]|uniref:sulfurtransferase complex subunit TusB n=1 Tax=Methyloprofundus sp. TaxID=2020875 RepID=UPI003D12756A
MLHIIRTSVGLEVLLDRVAEGDALLFVESAVLCLHKQSQSAQRIRSIDKPLQYYALQSDVLARGLSLATIMAEVSIVDYPGFVRLTVEHKVIKTWS